MSPSRPEQSPDQRVELVEAAQELVRQGLNHGSTGNLSVRASHAGRDGFWITPSACAPQQMTPEQMVFLDLEGAPLTPGAPSSEWRFHRDILASRPEVGAVVHTHSLYATALACQSSSIPPFHYMVAELGGPEVRCAPYSLFGTQALSNGALTALQGRWGCLLAHHGQIALGTGLGPALHNARALEALAQLYWHVCQVGPPRLLTRAQMEQVQARFQSYRPAPAPEPAA